MQESSGDKLLKKLSTTLRKHGKRLKRIASKTASKVMTETQDESRPSSFISERVRALCNGLYYLSV